MTVVSWSTWTRRQDGDCVFLFLFLLSVCVFQMCSWSLFFNKLTSLLVCPLHAFLLVICISYHLIFLGKYWFNDILDDIHEHGPRNTITHKGKWHANGCMDTVYELAYKIFHVRCAFYSVSNGQCRSIREAVKVRKGFTWHDLDTSKTRFRLKRNTAPNDKSPTRQDVL